MSISYGRGLHELCTRQDILPATARTHKSRVWSIIFDVGERHCAKTWRSHGKCMVGQCPSDTGWSDARVEKLRITWRRPRLFLDALSARDRGLLHVLITCLKLPLGSNQVLNSLVQFQYLNNYKFKQLILILLLKAKNKSFYILYTYLFFFYYTNSIIATLYTYITTLIIINYLS